MFYFGSVDYGCHLILILSTCNNQSKLHTMLISIKDIHLETREFCDIHDLTRYVGEIVRATDKWLSRLQEL